MPSPKSRQPARLRGAHTTFHTFGRGHRFPLRRLDLPEQVCTPGVYDLARGCREGVVKKSGVSPGV